MILFVSEAACILASPWSAEKVRSLGSQVKILVRERDLIGEDGAPPRSYVGLLIGCFTVIELD